MQQEFTNFEIIIVDDGSSDHSYELCCKYGKQDPRIKVFKKENGGAASARNYGIDVASGDYILFVDSDDYIPQNHLTVLYDTLIINNADISVAGITYVPGPEVKHTPVTVNSKQILEMLLYRDGIGDYPVSKLYRKELFQGLRYREGLPGEDFDLFFDLFSRAEKTAVTDKTTYYYCQRKGSASINKFSANLFGRIETCQKIQTVIEDDYPELQNALSACLVDEAINLYTATPMKYEKEHRWAEETVRNHAKQVLNDPKATDRLKRKIRIFSAGPNLWKFRMKAKNVYISLKEKI